MAYHRAATAPKAIPLGRPLVTKDPVPELLRTLCEWVDSPRSLAVFLLYNSGEHRQLVELSLDPLHYLEDQHQAFRLDALVTNLLSKYRDFDIDIDRESVAFQKWKDAEARCARINVLFRERWSGRALFPHRVEEVLHLARCKIHSLLGDIDYEYIRSHCHFGPGSDLDTKGDNTASYHKFGTKGAITPWALSVYTDIFGNDDSDRREDFAHNAMLRADSRLSFVPKNAKTDRSICVEPRWNVYAQLGVGRLIQKRLLRAHIDISSQQRNQDAARRAFTDGLATIDLSSASDSIAKNLVLDLVPDDWADLLLRIRCPSTLYRGQRYMLEKISSMGNGYTFPLETLIFYALAFASAKVSGSSDPEILKNVLAYGDDIVVPQNVAPLLIEALGCLGFDANAKKTFTSGCFYESCGQDYFAGKDVRPFFIKEKVQYVDQAYTLVNQVAAFATTCIGTTHFACSEVWSFRDAIIRRIPKNLRFFGPPEAGSCVIHDTFDMSRPRRHPRFEGWTFKGLIPVPNREIGFRYYGHLWSKLSGTVGSRQSVHKRGSLSYRVESVNVSTFTDRLLI